MGQTSINDHRRIHNSLPPTESKHTSEMIAQWRRMVAWPDFYLGAPETTTLAAYWAHRRAQTRAYQAHWNPDTGTVDIETIDVDATGRTTNSKRQPFATFTDTPMCPISLHNGTDHYYQLIPPHSPTFTKNTTQNLHHTQTTASQCRKLRAT
jgi:hypothetical protein